MTDIAYPDELESKIDVYERGRVLRTVPDQAWDIIFDTVHSYVDSIDQQHRNLPPGDSSVVASHAGLSVMSQFEQFFKEDLENAMDFAAHPDEEFTKYLSGFRDRLDVLKQQEA
jgi:hypothetical protein